MSCSDTTVCTQAWRASCLCRQVAAGTGLVSPQPAVNPLLALRVQPREKCATCCPTTGADARLPGPVLSAILSCTQAQFDCWQCLRLASPGH